MTGEVYDRKAVTALRERAAQKLAEIHQMVAPGTTASSPEVLRQDALSHMASLPPVEQEKLRRKAIAAYAELDRLNTEMKRHLDVVSSEIDKVSRHRRAVIAYHRIGQKARPGQARM
jgi:hypothetical protein